MFEYVAVLAKIDILLIIKNFSIKIDLWYLPGNIILFVLKTFKLIYNACNQ